jgi:diguanylate cyclase (GGDEF)-like protein
MDFRDVYEHAPVSLWVQDFSGIQSILAEIRQQGVVDLAAHLAQQPHIVDACMARIEVVEVNAFTLKLFRAADRETLLSNRRKIFRDEMRAHFAHELVLMWEGTLNFETEGINYALDGTPISIHLSRTVLPGHEKDWSRVLVSITDISERKRALDALKESESLAAGLFEHSPVSLWLEDFSAIRDYLADLKRQGVTNFRRYVAEHPKILSETTALIRVLDVNQRTLQLFDAPNKPTLLSNLGAVFRDDMEKHWKNELFEMWEGALGSAYEGVNYALNGTPIDVQVTTAPLPGAEQRWDRVLVALHDVTARKKAEAYMTYLGTHDTLTGLHNRAFFDDARKRFTVEKQFPLSVVMLDLNGLKRVNDETGHEAGDSLLRRAGEVLKKAIGSFDIACRMGGDEFAVLMPCQDERAARLFAAQIHHLSKLNNSYHAGSAVLDFAIGHASAEDETGVDAAYSLADSRMYEAKRKHYALNGIDRRS